MKSKFILLSAALMLSGLTSFAQQSVTTAGTHYSLLIEGTGAWCQHCSDGAVYVENVLAATPKVNALSEHNADGMSFAEGNVLDDSLNNGWPWGSVDMVWFTGQSALSLNRGVWQSKINERLAIANTYDLTMTHSYNQTSRTLTVTLTGKALSALTGKYNFNVYLTEDSVVGPAGNNYSQTNAKQYDTLVGHKYYHANNNAAKTKIDGFKHMQVLRAMIGGTWGTAAVTNPAANSSVTKTFTYVIPAMYDVLNVKLNKLKIIGVVHKEQNGAAITTTNYPEVINSVQAKVLPWATNVGTVSNFTEAEMFPNPAKDVIAVRALLNEPAETSVTITNAVGQVVFNQTYPKGGSMFAESINVSNFTNGLYFVTMNSNGSTSTGKLVVNK
ncbi:MAG: Omp28-related outer membrane protein [Bacteroidetes bacterium]|nr:Omp28-related outer membrane protein [Bacteroidota bacterium]